MRGARLRWNPGAGPVPVTVEQFLNEHALALSTRMWSHVAYDRLVEAEGQLLNDYGAEGDIAPGQRLLPEEWDRRLRVAQSPKAQRKMKAAAYHAQKQVEIAARRAAQEAQLQSDPFSGDMPGIGRKEGGWIHDLRDYIRRIQDEEVQLALLLYFSEILQADADRDRDAVQQMLAQAQSDRDIDAAIRLRADVDLISTAVARAKKRMSMSRNRRGQIPTPVPDQGYDPDDISRLFPDVYLPDHVTRIAKLFSPEADVLPGSAGKRVHVSLRARKNTGHSSRPRRQRVPRKRFR